MHLPPRRAMILMGAGTALLLVALVTPWYQISLTGTNPVETTFYLWGVQTSSPHGSGGLTAYDAGPSSSTLPATGELYAWACGLGFVAAVLAVGALLALGRRPRPDRRLFLALAIAAMAIAGTVPLLVAAEQPSAICSDAAYFSPPLGGSGGLSRTGEPTCTWEFNLGGGGWSSGTGSSQGPQSTFLGWVPGGNFFWTPSVGWAAELAGFVLVGWAAVSVLRSDEAAPTRSGSPPVRPEPAPASPEAVG